MFRWLNLIVCAAGVTFAANSAWAQETPFAPVEVEPVAPEAALPEPAPEAPAEALPAPPTPEGVVPAAGEALPAPPELETPATEPAPVPESSTPAESQPAEEEKSEAPVFDFMQMDDDFALQGEYMGQLFTGAGDSGWQWVGLQVAALGKGQYTAMVYPNGLPGAGWGGGAKHSLGGFRDVDMLKLSGDRIAIRAENGIALLYLDGTQAGSWMQKFYRTSPTMGAPVPPSGRSLFNGTGTENWVNARVSPEGWLMEGTETAEPFNAFTMHLEFMLPYMPEARGQGRANSGVYLQSRYEIQILDSFALEGAENECGALYRLRSPDVNMAFPPLTWQTYDIHFVPPVFDASNTKIANARITLWHNGIPIHDDVEITRKTGGGEEEGPTPLPTRLQDHHNPIRFRNIWIVEHDPSLYANIPGVAAPALRPDPFPQRPLPLWTWGAVYPMPYYWKLQPVDVAHH